MIDLNRCYVGDCRRIMRDWISQGVKVQTVVTSPPYWGLRDYGIEPSVWGGLTDCDHQWGAELKIHKGGPHGNGVMLEGGRSVVDAQAKTKDYRAGQFCHCGAWLGTLGLEPDYRMFIDHMVEVFGLVRDVLADDGTLWLNLGDSYHGGNRGKSDKGDRGAGSAVQQFHLAADLQGSPNRLPQVGLKPKDLCMMPARVAIALQEAGWWVRQDIIWAKPAPMPESVKDRCTKSHEYLFMLTKSKRYYFDQHAISEEASPNTHSRGAGVNPKSVAGWDDGPGAHVTVEHAVKGPKDEGRAAQGLRDSTKFGRGAGWRDKDPASPKYRDAGPEHRSKQGLAAAERRSRPRQNESFSAAVAGPVQRRNKRSVWTVAAEPYAEAHFATFPRKLIEPCILAGSRPGDIVLDPFLGSGTTAQVAEHLGRKWLGCEMNPDYLQLQRDRLRQQSLAL